MDDRQIVDPALLTDLEIIKLQVSQNILINLLNASSFQTSNLLRPETIDFIMDAFDRIHCRLELTTLCFTRDEKSAPPGAQEKP
jgi:tRNA A37 threonylcarbamoyladenosine dehydratase